MLHENSTDHLDKTFVIRVELLVAPFMIKATGRSQSDQLQARLRRDNLTKHDV